MVAAADGRIDGNRPAALPGAISVVLLGRLFSSGSGPGTIGAMLGTSVASVVGVACVGVGNASRTDSDTARGCESVPAEAWPTALTVMEFAACLAVTRACSSAGVLPGAGIVHELRW